MAEVPTAEQLLSLVRREHSARIALGKDVDFAEASRFAHDLKQQLPGDVVVFASPFSPPQLTVIQLINDFKAEAVLPSLHSLVADFQSAARELTDVLRREVMENYEEGRDYPDAIHVGGGLWHLHIHGDDCRFESAETGQIVEACIDLPDRLDPYFLLEYARTSPNGYPDVLAACVAGFHDMDRLMALGGYR
jgi:hypothetical protein